MREPEPGPMRRRGARLGARKRRPPPNAAASSQPRLLFPRYSSFLLNLLSVCPYRTCGLLKLYPGRRSK